MEQFDLVTLISGVLSSAKILLQQKEAQVIFDASEPVMVHGIIQIVGHYFFYLKLIRPYHEPFGRGKTH